MGYWLLTDPFKLTSLSQQIGEKVKGSQSIMYCHTESIFCPFCSCLCLFACLKVMIYNHQSVKHKKNVINLKGKTWLLELHINDDSSRPAESRFQQSDSKTLNWLLLFSANGFLFPLSTYWLFWKDPIKCWMLMYFSSLSCYYQLYVCRQCVRYLQLSWNVMSHKIQTSPRLGYCFFILYCSVLFVLHVVKPLLWPHADSSIFSRQRVHNEV